MHLFLFKIIYAAMVIKHGEGHEWSLHEVEYHWCYLKNAIF